MIQWFAVAAMVGACAWLAAAVSTASAQTCAAPGNANTVCSGNCAAVSVGSVSGSQGGTVQIPVMFTQGPDDGQAGQGYDNVAAIAFTLGVPGTADGNTPLSFDCTSGDLASGSVTGLNGDFNVVIENAQCTGRSRCLCPDTSAGQTQDNFVNVVVYGPKNLPEQGPVQIPELPAGPTAIVTLTMRIAQTAATGDVPQHVFSALDNGSPAKPQFAANLSIGDQAACDVTANTQNRSNVTFTDGKVTVTTGNTNPCVGDCNSNHTVAINELVVGVNIALGLAQPSTCVAFEDQNQMVTISQLVKGVNNALNGCPAA